MIIGILIGLYFGFGAGLCFISCGIEHGYHGGLTFKRLLVNVISLVFFWPVTITIEILSD